MIKSIVIDDEAASRETLTDFVTRYCDGVEVLGSASNIEEGQKLIAAKQPDLVFLDIEMPYGNAFDLLERLDKISFQIIFVTAFSQYAIQALNASAAYYLLKPISIDELEQAVEKVKEVIAEQGENIQARVLMENIQTRELQSQKLVLPIFDGYEVVRTSDIVRCQAADNFTEFHFRDGAKKLICRTLKHFDSVLSPAGFLRVHKSHLVNARYIARYKRGKGGQLFLEDGSAVDVSPSRKEAVLAYLQNELG